MRVYNERDKVQEMVTAYNTKLSEISGCCSGEARGVNPPGL
jgi:hypothetical protein